MSSSSFFTSSQSQKRWRDHMRHNYISNHDIRPCVFQVPDNLRDTKPDAYIPQLIGLGPYHHFRAELQLMESKKRAAVKDYLEIVDFNDFIDLIDKSPEEFEPITRSCYDRYLDLDKETLSWIVIVDGIFLLHFIDTYFGPEEEKHKIYSNVGKLVPDVWMLENQIPIVLILGMRKILELSFDVPTDDELFDKFRRFCSEHSPLELTSVAELKREAFDKNNHMLHFMYQMIMNNNRPDDDQGHSQSQSKEDDDFDGKSEGDDTETLRKRVEVLAQEAKNQGSEILKHAIEEFNSALTTATNAGLKVPGNIQKVSQILRNLEKTFQFNHNKEMISGDKIQIPSVSRLIAILKIKFKPLPKGCGIGDIALDRKKNKLYLPVIHMHANSEVILRNLVAYEATISKQQGSTQIRDYVDLMCGIIKSEKDVQLLRQAGIVKPLKGGLPDQEIVNICNGIKKSDENPDEKSKVHSTTKDVNNHFNNARVVKFCRWLMKCVADFVKFCKPFFPVMVLIFLGFQSACEIFDCRLRSQGGAALQKLYLGDDYLELDTEDKLLLPRKLLRH